VSEYQYYDFRALDRPLTRNEKASLRSISTRAAITATSFTNHYEWCDLKANPSKLLEKYFDAFVYVANSGTREFHIRLPQGSIDYKRSEPQRLKNRPVYIWMLELVRRKSSTGKLYRRVKKDPSGAARLDSRWRWG
jgi:hypothetical protein